MKRFSVFLALLVLGASSLVAQGRPNFSGHWTLIPDSTKSSSGMAGMAAADATIVQDDKTITVTRTTPMGEVKLVYNLDGSDSKNTVQMGANAMDMLSKVKWDGNKLVVNTTINAMGNTVETSATYSLDAGGNMVVEQTVPGPSGPTTVKASFKKS